MNKSDRAARVCLYSSVFWLLVGSFAYLLAAAKLVRPGSLAGPHLSYGRLTAAASTALQYGWVALAGLAAMFYVLPRVTGGPLRSERAGSAAASLFNLATALIVSMNLLVGPQGPPFMELSIALVVVLVVAGLLAAVNVVATIVSRAEERIYASAWYFAGASIWAPLCLIAGRLIPMDGASEWIQASFAVSSVFNLWFAAVGIGALYYVLPRATGAPLYSHRLALVGFWTLAFLGPLSGTARHVFGPSPSWLQTVAISASIGLLIPAATVFINTFGTLRGHWERVPSHPSVRFMVGGTILWSAAVALSAITSMRSVARVVGATDWVTGQIWIALLGGFTLWGMGLITYALPRLIGRRWLSGPWMAASFWLAASGVVLVGVSALASGALTAAVWNAGVANQVPLSSGGSYSVVLSTVARARVLGLLGALSFLLGQSIFALNLFRTTSSGEPRPVEMVLPAEVL